MKSLVVASKGGVGKSTIARAIAAVSKSALYEVDPANKGQGRFASLETKQYNLSSLESVSELYLDLSTKNDVVVDLGVEHISTYINEMSESGLIALFDLVIIPMFSDRQSIENAIKTYNAIKNSVQKIVFCFNRAKSADKAGVLNEFGYFIELAKKNNVSPINAINIPESTLFNIEQDLEKTIFEMANDETDYKNAAQEEISKPKGNREQAIKIMQRSVIRERAKSLLTNSLLPAYNKLQELAINEA